MSHATHAPAPVFEEVGPLFGRINTLTHPRRLLPVTEGPVDEGKVSAARRLLGDRSRIHDLVVHGVRVRLFTNSHHLNLCAREHFWSASEWRAETGAPLEGPPAVTVFAVTGAHGDPEARYDASLRLGMLTNTAHFGTLRGLILEAAGRILQKEWGIQTLPGAAIGWGDRVALLTGSAGIGVSALAQGLLREEGTRFMADGAVHVRFMVPATLGRWVHPVGAPAGDRLKVLRADHAVEEFAAKDVTLGAPPRPMVYPAEKVPYLSADLAAFFPDLSEAFKTAHGENVPSPEGRVLLDVRGRLGPSRAWTHPLEPAEASCLFRLRRDPADRRVAETLESAEIKRIPAYSLNLVRPPQELARLVVRLLRNPPERLHITAESLEGYLR